MARKNAALAAQRVEKYNALTDKVEALERRLIQARMAQTHMRQLAFEALPEGYGIKMGDRFELSHWAADFPEQVDHPAPRD